MPPPPLTILVVEDHADTLRALLRVLDRHHVHGAASCQAAVAAAARLRRPLDVLICDVGLPDGDGAELMRRFKDDYACRTIALTGYGQAEHRARYLEMGIDQLLVKPIDVDELDEALDDPAPARPHPLR